MTRSDWTREALALVGLTYPDPAYVALVAPGDTGARQLEVARSSGCMLARAGLEEALALFPARDAYVTGSIPGILERRAGGSPMAPGGACRRATMEAPPQIGDGLWWGAVPGGAPEHVDACVVSVECVATSDDLTVGVVAGGQRDAAGDECVALLSRRISWRGGHWVDVGDGRQLVAVLDAGLYSGAETWRKES